DGIRDKLVTGVQTCALPIFLPDLRGYGDSSLPEAGPNNINFSFRAMAQDMVEVMEQLGYISYFVAGHDRGARTTHRMCLDHAERSEERRVGKECRARREPLR